MGGLVPPGFEGRFRPSAPPEMERPFTLENAEKKALEVLKRGSVRMEDFSDLYHSDVIARDMEYANSMQGKFEQGYTPQQFEAQKLANILEAAIHDQVNNNKWFGSRTKAIRTTKFDDIVNGVDSVLEFTEPNVSASYMALGIDVTYSSDLSKKFERIKEEIDRGELAKIKYLKSSDGTFRGALTQVPRLVVALDGENTKGLARAWYQNAPGLSINPTRFQLVNELLMQLQVFEGYASQIGQNNLAQKYRTSRLIMERVQQEITPSKQSIRKHDTSDNSAAEFMRGLSKFA